MKTLLPSIILLALGFTIPAEQQNIQRVKSLITANNLATITLNLYTADDSSHVNKSFAKLYDASGKEIRSVQPSGNQVVFSGLTTAVEQLPAQNIPQTHKLSQNFPNPFNPSTKIEFYLPHSETVDLSIYDVRGREIAKVNRHLGTGFYEAEWLPNAAAGVYFCRIRTLDFQQTRKMNLIDGEHGSGQLEIRSKAGSTYNYSEKAVPPTNPNATGNVLKGNAAQSADYSVEIRDTTSTTPHIINRLIQFMNLESDITRNVYLDRKMRNLSGTLTDYENNPMLGYIMAINALGDTAIVKTEAHGQFLLRTKPSLGDTIKGQIINPNHPDEAFIRTIYVPGSDDKMDLVVDAVPLLPDNFYCGADTVAAWVREGNLDFDSPKGLKKAKLDSLKEVITSINKSSGDTMKVVEQMGLMNVLQTSVDTLFTNKPTYYIVPQDSAMKPDGYRNAINHFKDHNVSNGELATWDDNNDGILDGGYCGYRLIMLIRAPNDTVYNSIVMAREDFRARVMPNETGLTSPIPKWFTITHIGTTAKAPTIGDRWWAKFAEHYPVKTLPENTLVVGNMAPIFDRLKK